MKYTFYEYDVWPKWPFLHMYGSHDMRLVDFRGLTGSQRKPRDRGVTAWYQSEGKRLPWELCGCRVRYTKYLELDGHGIDHTSVCILVN